METSALFNLIMSIDFFKINKGFSLAFATLIGSLLAVVGAFLAGIGLKEVNLASSLRESAGAFYGSDTALSCALFYDFQGNGVFLNPANFTASTYSISCGTFNTTVTPTLVNANEVSNVFQLPLFTDTAILSDDVCAGVEVIKRNTGATTIKSRAVNGPCSSRKAIMVERGLQVDY